jgi:hypothetical protein
MAAGHEGLVEQTLWEALRMFEESASLYRRMAERARADQPDMSRRYTERVEEIRQRTDVLRRLLLGENGFAPQPPPPDSPEGRHAGLA